jgi:6-carboxyhexanoate--CoA ligase
LAELCISDNPDYTTGYVALRKYGYIRIPHIKRKGRKNGGRVFFIEEHTDRDSVIEYLEKTPVLINKTSDCFGVCTIDEILGGYNR